MKPSPAWLYGGTLYVVAVTTLFAVNLLASNPALYMTGLVASLPFGIAAHLCNYYLLFALILLGADPTAQSDPLSLLFLPAWAAAAAGNAALAWAAWSGAHACLARGRGTSCRFVPRHS